MATIEEIKRVMSSPLTERGKKFLPDGFDARVSPGRLRTLDKQAAVWGYNWTPDRDAKMVAEIPRLGGVTSPLDQIQGPGWMVWLKRSDDFTPIGFFNPGRQSMMTFKYLHFNHWGKFFGSSCSNYLVEKRKLLGGTKQVPYVISSVEEATFIFNKIMDDLDDSKVFWWLHNNLEEYKNSQAGGPRIERL